MTTSKDSASPPPPDGFEAPRPSPRPDPGIEAKIDALAACAGIYEKTGLPEDERRVVAARAALVSAYEEIARERDALRVLNKRNADVSARTADHLQARALAAESALRAAPSAQKEEGRAEGLEEAARILADAWDDGPQGPPRSEIEESAEIVILRARAREVRTAARVEPTPATTPTAGTVCAACGGDGTALCHAVTKVTR